ncbi:MAG: proton-conducting transporter membrane subunit [Candidatus Micrarchaeaceae archaeon]
MLEYFLIALMVAFALASKLKRFFSYASILFLVLASAFSVSANSFSSFFIFSVGIAIFLCDLIAIALEERYEDYVLLASFSFVGVFFLASSTNIINTLLALELATVPGIVIALLYSKKAEASIKFFVGASVSIAVFAFGATMFFMLTGNVSFGIAKSPLIYIAALLFAIALSFEASLFPFNILIPDIYEGVKGSATALFGSANKKIGLLVLIQLTSLLFFYLMDYRELIIILSILTMFYGNLSALRQKNMKRLMAYSSISQAGYIAIGIAAFSQQGIASSLVQIFAHIILFAGILAVLSFLESKERVNVDDLIGLHQESPVMAVSLSIMMLSLVGIPFTIGFIGKFLIFLSAINSGVSYLAVLGIINSIISIYYYAKPIIASFSSKAEYKSFRFEKGYAISASIALSCTLIAIFLGIFPKPIISFASGSANYLISHIQPI